MKELTIRLKSFEDVNSFVQIVSSEDGKAELHSERYQINAKSLLSIFSLDLTKPLSLRLYRPSRELENSLRRYRISA